MLYYHNLAEVSEFATRLGNQVDVICANWPHFIQKDIPSSSPTLASSANDYKSIMLITKAIRWSRGLDIFTSAEVRTFVPDTIRTHLKHTMVPSNNASAAYRLANKRADITVRIELGMAAGTQLTDQARRSDHHTDHCPLGRFSLA